MDGLTMTQIKTKIAFKRAFRFVFVKLKWFESWKKNVEKAIGYDLARIKSYYSDLSFN